jgi:MFS family permease
MMAQATPVEGRLHEGKANHRLFWRFWSGSTISGAGTAVTAVAMPLLAVLLLHASSFQTGLLAAAADLAWLLIGLPAGVIVGRWALRRTQVVMDVVRALAVGSVPVAYLMHDLHFAQLVVVALIVGFATVVFDVGNSIFLVSIVSEDELAKRNSLATGSDATVQLGGPSTAGLLVQLFGAPLCLLIDAISYGVSAILLRSLPRPEQTPPAPGFAPSAVTLIGDGWRYVVRHKTIRPCMVAATLLNLTVGSLLGLVPIYLVRTLHVKAALVGLLMAADGAGSLIGAAIAVTLAARLGSARAVLVASAVSATTVVLLPLARTSWGLVLFGIGSAGFALGITVLSILTRTYRQSATPREMLPRVMATVRFVSWGAMPVGAILAGLLASSTTNRTALTVACVPTLLVPAVLWGGSVGRRRDWPSAQ